MFKYEHFGLVFFKEEQKIVQNHGQLEIDTGRVQNQQT